MTSMLKDTSILITGGTGTFGRAMVHHLFKRLGPEGPRRIIVFSRDEFKQHEMREALGADPREQLRFFLGDVRDRARLEEAFRGVDYVIHAAALKQVPAAEYNPTEAVKTNVGGATNVTAAAIATGVKRVVLLSTDKAVNPVNLYGATKLAAERLFIAANALAGNQATRFAVVRYGNVTGSRGSVLPIFLRLAQEGGEIPITSKQMTRFWITVRQALDFALLGLDRIVGGEVFVPKLRTARIVDLAEAVAPGQPVKVIGVRRGEKLHETLISAEEGGRTLDYGAHFVIMPDFDWRESDRQLSLGVAAYQRTAPGAPIAVPAPDGFTYHSDARLDPHLTVEELRELLVRSGLV